MKVIYGIGNLSKGPKIPKVIAVGVFDGVHRGHQMILRRVVRQAKKCKAHADDASQYHVGDVVRIQETRPLSKEKHWKVVAVVRHAANDADAGVEIEEASGEALSE